MTFNWSRSSICLLLFLVLSSVAPAAEWKARVLSVTGSVTLGNPPKKVVPMSQLSKGTKLTLGPKAKVVLQYPNGLFVLQQRAGHFFVGSKDKEVKVVKNSLLADEHFRRVDEVATALSFRGRKKSVDLLSPKGAIFSSRPTFRFRVSGGGAPFSFTLENFDDGEIVFAEELMEETFSYPIGKKALLRGGNYMWHIKCGSMDAEGEFFTVASDEVCNELRKIKEAAKELAREFGEPQLFDTLMQRALEERNFNEEAKQYSAN